MVVIGKAIDSPWCSWILCCSTFVVVPRPPTSSTCGGHCCRPPRDSAQATKPEALCGTNAEGEIFEVSWCHVKFFFLRMWRCGLTALQRGGQVNSAVLVELCAVRLSGFGKSVHMIRFTGVRNSFGDVHRVEARNVFMVPVLCSWLTGVIPVTCMWTKACASLHTCRHVHVALVVEFASARKITLICTCPRCALSAKRWRGAETVVARTRTGVARKVAHVACSRSGTVIHSRSTTTWMFTTRSAYDDGRRLSFR